MSKWVMFSSVLHSQRHRKYWSLWHGKQSGNYIGVLWKEEILFHNNFITKNLRKCPEHPVLPGHCFGFNLPLLQVKKGCGVQGCQASFGFLKVRRREREQEGISTGFLLSMERKIRINGAWFPFVARGMSEGVAVPPARSKAGLAPGGTCAYGCAGLGAGLFCPRCPVTKTLCGFKGFAQKLSVPSIFFFLSFFSKLIHKWVNERSFANYFET